MLKTKRKMSLKIVDIYFYLIYYNHNWIRDKKIKPFDRYSKGKYSEGTLQNNYLRYI